MERANPADMRKSLAAADEFKKAGILFVPMPVLDKEDGRKLAIEAFRRLDVLEKVASDGKVGP